MNETKRDKFVRLAETRTNKILNMIELLGNLSNQSAYDYTKSDVDQIFNAIESSLKDSKRRFEKESAAKGKSFKLKG